jgi:cation diffusion facilitator CzcD-associated flavoprotein CzcO
MRLREAARIAVIGAGPSGLVAAKHALDAGFDPHVLEASDDLGGQWRAGAPHSGIWPGMHTNTSRAMTAFSDLPGPDDLPLHPSAPQMLAYLHAYAQAFGLRARIRFDTRVERVTPGWEVDGEPFDAVVVATGRFCKPAMPPGLGGFAGELLHGFDYPGAEPFRGRRVLVYGNGISGLEIASDLAPVTDVLSACRKPRYVIPKNAGGVSSDWYWYTAFAALERTLLPRDVLGRTLRQRVLRIAGDPAAFGAPAPDPDLFVAGLGLCQDYLGLVREGRIACRPAIAALSGHTVTFTDGTSDHVDAIVCATGYTPHVPYLDDPGPLYRRTLHPGLPGFAAIGQYFAMGPYWPLLELQARWVMHLWSGAVDPPSAAAMREAIATPQPLVEYHDAFATAIAREAGVAPDLPARPELTEPLLFGPLLPPRYRLDGPHARPDAAAQFARQLAASPRPPADRQAIPALRGFGLHAEADLLSA